MKQFILIFSLLIVAMPALAHQPRTVEETRVMVPEPEVSKAYYGELSGEPHTYTIDSAEPFALYVNILVPDIESANTNITATVSGNGEELATIGGAEGDWERYFEEFGRSYYLQADEYKKEAEPGEYTVTVFSPNNEGKYSLAIGEREAFGFGDGVDALMMIPELKREFFEESPANFILSPFGWGYALAVFVATSLVGLLARVVLLRLDPSKEAKNLGRNARATRLLAGAILFLIAIYTSWHIVLFVLASLMWFETLIGWSPLVHAFSGKRRDTAQNIDKI